MSYDGGRARYLSSDEDEGCDPHQHERFEKRDAAWLQILHIYMVLIIVWIHYQKLEIS
jgi:hypothetical protein